MRINSLVASLFLLIIIGGFSCKNKNTGNVSEGGGKVRIGGLLFPISMQIVLIPILSRKLLSDHVFRIRRHIVIAVII